MFGSIGGQVSASQPYTAMPLTKDQLQEIQAAALADDVAIDMEKMSLWTQEEATAFFESGGTVAPAPKKAVDPPSSGDSALLAAKEKGSAQLKANDLSAAAASYREALALCTGPELTEKHAAALHSNLAMVLLKMGDAPASLEAADACVGVKPDWHKAHYRKGEALFALKRHTDAAAAYEAAQKLAPSDSDIGRAKQLATEAAKGGVWFRQLLPGRDIALKPSSQIEQLSFGAAAQMQNYIYLIGDATTRECFVVDACWDPAGIAAYAERHKMRLVGAIASHYHFDHVGGTLPPQMQGMVFGPFGVPKGVEPRLPGVRRAIPPLRRAQPMHYDLTRAPLARLSALPLVMLNPPCIVTPWCACVRVCVCAVCAAARDADQSRVPAVRPPGRMRPHRHAGGRCDGRSLAARAGRHNPPRRGRQAPGLSHARPFRRLYLHRCRACGRRAALGALCGRHDLPGLVRPPRLARLRQVRHVRLPRPAAHSRRRHSRVPGPRVRRCVDHDRQREAAGAATALHARRVAHDARLRGALPWRGMPRRRWRCGWPRS